ncbi:hypothetical protein V4V35_23890 [Bacillus infantis]|uniref:DUF6906 family protein n=1 Tax=Bacillus infantis TaxID=324767 RepID=UPI002FBDCDC7
MSEEKKKRNKSEFPRWIELTYYDEKTGGILKYTGSAGNPNALFNLFDRLNLRKADVVQIFSNEHLIGEEEKNKLFDWVDKKRREKAEQMKNGKSPSRKQKEALQQANLDPAKHLIVKNLTKELHVINIETQRVAVIPA